MFRERDDGTTIQGTLTVIIPSYNCQYVSKTVEDLFEKAETKIQVIVLLDNYWPTPIIKGNSNLIIIHKGENTGMRDSINMGARLSTGEFLMKTDDHCIFSPGFDKALIAGSSDHQVSIPSRYSIDVPNWCPIREPVSYEFLTYPYVYLDKHRYGCGLVAKKWLGDDGINPLNMGKAEFYKKEYQRKGILIDEIMVFHGSCWFMPKEYFFLIGGLEAKLFKTLYQEPQEILFKTWLSGGRVVVNKNAWYAHMFKGGDDLGRQPHARGYKLDLTAMRETERFGTALWMGDRWAGAVKPIKWLIEKFWPIPGWPETWEQEKVEWEKKYPIALEEKYALKGV